MKAAYPGFSMTTPLAQARNAAIMGFMQDARTASTDRIAQGTGIEKRAACRHIWHLCDTGNLVRVQDKKCNGSTAAVYAYVEGTEYADSISEPSQRMVGTDEWQRGEHAHRSGLLALFFPLAKG